ncbi:unnamed protein product [Knipowitschia caucasica]
MNPLEALMSVQQRLGCRPGMDPPRADSSSSSSSSSNSSNSRSNNSSNSSSNSRSSQAQRSKTRAPLGSVPLPRVQRSQHSPENAARERSRVRNLRQAFHRLQAALPAVPPDTKLSKLDVLLLATNYISALSETLDREGTRTELHLSSRHGGHLHPVKKWPMRSLLYCGSVGARLQKDPGGATGGAPGSDTD